MTDFSSNASFDVPPLGDPTGSAEPLRFTGRGGEYFGIWIVNLLLTVFTLGIYSAWAKVRRLQYFHRNTLLAGSPFDYHGSPTAILKGRIIALVLLIVYNVAAEFSAPLAVIAFLALAAVLPLLLMRSLRFRAHNTSWRGLRFAFDGQGGGAYSVFLLWPALSALTLWLLAPMWHQRLKRYQQQNLRFGATGFSFDVGVGAFYRVYLVALGLLMLAAIGVALLLGATIASRTQAISLVPLIMIAALLAVGPYLTARTQNLVWNHTQLGAHRFESRVSARRLYLIAVTNLLAIVFTLGLFIPFAAIRSARYRIESVSMISAGSLDDFATGEGAADLFDVDLGL